MLYAKIVLGIPVEGPFDYIVPSRMAKNIKVGSRVSVNFCGRELIGYVVDLTRKTNIKRLKTIIDLIDIFPVLTKNMLLVTKELSCYYCCSWGEAIETALPIALRKGREISNLDLANTEARDSSFEATLIHDLQGSVRWDLYLNKIKEAIASNRSVILLLPDIELVFRAKEIIVSHLGVTPRLLYRKQRQELKEWASLREPGNHVVIGTRSAIFAPLNNLGLIVIDEEQNSVYKQDQVPHYNARQVAFMRSGIEKVNLILGSSSPSLEMLHLAKSNKIKYILIARKKPFPEIKIVDIGRSHYDPKRVTLLSKYLQDSISLVLNSGGKVLLFLNRIGFATFASCRYCGMVLKCPRCNINLVYHFKDNVLSCHYCNYKTTPYKICPNCNSSYIRYSGAGTEKIESELSRLFPQVKIKVCDDFKEINISDADIFVATSSIFKQINLNFDLIGVLSIDSSLNRIDFGASEKTFDLLASLLLLTEKKIIIQTHLSSHHSLRALEKKDIDIFYNEELEQRKELKFPPYQHLGLIKMRGRDDLRVKEISNIFFDKLKKNNKTRGITIFSVSPAQPAKLRGNFYWQILIGSKDAKKISKFIKIKLKDLRYSGIIVTVDIDPI